MMLLDLGAILYTRRCGTTLYCEHVLPHWRGPVFGNGQVYNWETVQITVKQRGSPALLAFHVSLAATTFAVSHPVDTNSVKSARFLMLF